MLKTINCAVLNIKLSSDDVFIRHHINLLFLNLPLNYNLYSQF